MTTRIRTVAAASRWVRAQLAGPAVPAPVLHRGADAVYLDARGACLGVLSAAATAVPCGARTSLPRLPAGMLGDGPVLVGDGRVAFAGADVVVVRTVDTRVPPLPPAAAPQLAATLAAAVGDRLAPVAGEVPGEALAQLASAQPRAAVAPLLGRGSGLTPLGDDVMAGWLATAVATGALPKEGPAAAPAAAVRDEVSRLAAGATTLLSATLLHCAARGEVLPEFRRLLLELPGGAGPPVQRSVAALLAVGHTSGAGLLLGSLLALRHLATRSS